MIGTWGGNMNSSNGKTQDAAFRNMPPHETLIRFENVTKTFHEGDNDRAVLQGVNAAIARGEFVAIVGRSGSGKSTLLHLLAGLDTPTSGDILIGDTNIAKLSDNDRTLFRRNHIGFVFQFFNLIPTLTVRENVLLTAELSGWKQDRARAQATRLLEAVGLQDRLAVFPDKLSGGEQQRVAIARALCADPDLVLADEPTGNLDADTGMQILDLLTNLVRGRGLVVPSGTEPQDKAAQPHGKTLVMVTHSPDVAAAADRVLRMEHGKLLAPLASAASAERSLTNPPT